MEYNMKNRYESPAVFSVVISLLVFALISAYVWTLDLSLLQKGILQVGELLLSIFMIIQGVALHKYHNHEIFLKGVNFDDDEKLEISDKVIELARRR